MSAKYWPFCLDRNVLINSLLTPQYYFPEPEPRGQHADDIFAGCGQWDIPVCGFHPPDKSLLWYHWRGGSLAPEDPRGEWVWYHGRGTAMEEVPPTGELFILLRRGGAYQWQDGSISSRLAMEILQSWAKPSIYADIGKTYRTGGLVTTWKIQVLSFKTFTGPFFQH